MSIELLKVKVDDPFYPEFYNEGIFLLEHKYLEKKQALTEKLETEVTKEDKRAVIPTLDKKLLVLIKFRKEGEVLSSYKNMLTKMLSAINYKPSMTDIIVLNKFEGIGAKEFLIASQANKVLGFGIDEKNNEGFAHIKFNGKEIITAAPLESLAHNNAFKMKLWNLMKQLFNV